MFSVVFSTPAVLSISSHEAVGNKTAVYRRRSESDKFTREVHLDWVGPDEEGNH